MPYRRLPNTDTKRSRAMRIVLDKAEELPVFKLPFSMGTVQKVKTLYPNLEKHIILQKEALKAQVSKQKEYLGLYKKAKMYVSHFIQVMNMAISRGELNKEIYKLYGFSAKTVKVPSFKNENELIEIGSRLINGEKERIYQGGNPITNPTIALVNVHFENFSTSRIYQKQLQENYQRCTNTILELRPQVDKLIQVLWNEIENYFSNLPEEDKRSLSSEFGVEYVYRKSELQKNNKNEIIVEEDQQIETKQYSISF
jgi:hypothetical protein